VTRTRFAPSPTGSLHLGNARVAALNWLFARHTGGTFILRIEDTDTERTIDGAGGALLADLRWLGLDWQEGPGEEGPDVGPHAPYHQSRRSQLYGQRAAELRARGLAYACFCTDEELAERRERALAGGGTPHYDRRCLALPPAESTHLQASGRPFVLRFRVPDEGSVLVRDVIRGDIAFEADALGDFVILRSDGRATYNFAVVVDDVAMQITHVIRGSGHLSNTPRQVLLFNAFGAVAPRFVHVPSVLGPDRQKLSKRHGAQALAEYRAAGYHPDAVLNYLSLLSWSSPSGREVLSRDELIHEIELERMGSADVVFDPVKLRWLSGKHIERMPLPELLAALEPFLDRERMPVTEEKLPVAVAAIRSHLTTLGDINEQLEAFRLARKQPLPAGTQPIVRAVAAALGDLESWDEQTISAAVRAAGESAGVKGKALFAPLRHALTGGEHGPPLAAVIAAHDRGGILAHLDGLLEAS
jgi:glutamyl-tRNA synthetase